MTYTTSAQVKGYLGIADTSFDVVINQLVSDADVEINSILNIDGFDSATKSEEVVSFKNVYEYGGGYYRFPVKNLNVQAVTEINWTSYTGVKWVEEDYFIKLGRIVYLDDLYNYVTNTSFDSFTITYTYWRSTLPGDVELLARFLVVRNFVERYPLYATSSNQLPGVSSYQLADEKIQFDTKRLEKDNKKIEDILKKYKKVHVF